MAAFQSLGPFISTFADPAKTGLYYTDGGLIVLEDGKDQESNSSGSTDSGCSTDSHHSNEEPFCTESSVSISKTQSSLLPSFVHSLSLNETKTPATTTTSTPSPNVMMAQSQVAAAIVTSVPVSLSYAKHVIPPPDSDRRRRCSHDEESLFRSTFSEFQFWRIPISDPAFDPAISCIDIAATSATAVTTGLLPAAGQKDLAGDEREEGMVIDPPPPEEDDCQKEKLYYNSHGDDQEGDAQLNTERMGVRGEELNQDPCDHRPQAEAHAVEQTAGGGQHRPEVHEQGGGGSGVRLRPDHSSSAADEAEMRDNEIGDDSSLCISSFPGNHHQHQHPLSSIITGSQNQESPGGPDHQNPAHAAADEPQHQQQQQPPPPPYNETKAATATPVPLQPSDESESMDQEECENEIVTVSNTVHPEQGPAVDHNFDCDTPVKSLTATSDLTTATTTTAIEQEINSNESKRPFLTFFNSTGDNQQGLGEPSALSAVMSGANYQRILNQESIPSDLLKHFLSMTSPVNYESVDHELSHYCAYSFPAVAMTLGRKHWPCLMATYESLAADVQWKVRLTLASSLHQMAVILGPKYTSRDLIPIFFQFMTDLDEVRFGILQNLSCIMRLLNRSEQLSILPRIVDFLRMDNPRNWRFRQTLADQVVTIAPLFSPTEIREHLLPIAYTLLKDKVSDVRLSAIHLLSTLMRHFFFFCDTSNHLRHSPPPFSTAMLSSSTTTSDQQPACYIMDNSNVNINNINNNNNLTSSNAPLNQTSGSSIPSTQSSDRQRSFSTTTTIITKTAVSSASTTTSCSTSTSISNARLPLDQVSLELISDLTALVRSPKWVFRQAFVFLCEQMITDQSLPVQVFNDHFFDCLLSLKGDRVSNVRLALSRCMQRSIHGNVMFHEKQDLVFELLQEFAKDSDSDVRRFARLVVDPPAVNAAYLEMMSDYDCMSGSPTNPSTATNASDEQQVRNQDADHVFLSGNRIISAAHLHNSNNTAVAAAAPDSDSSSSWLSSARISLIPREPALPYTQPPPPPFPSSRISETSSVAQVLQPEVESVIEADPDPSVKDNQDSGSVIRLNAQVDDHNNVTTETSDSTMSRRERRGT